MPILKLSKMLIDAAEPGKKEYELRDQEVAGFLVRVVPGGRKTFMLEYRTEGGERRKPAIGRVGTLTVQQAREIAKDWLAKVRFGQDPSHDRKALRKNPTMREFCSEFLERHADVHCKPSTIASYKSTIRVHIIPKLGHIKVDSVKRGQIFELMHEMADMPGAANATLSCLKKMFNCAELWEYRVEGANPCRLVRRYPGGARTRLIKNPELVKLFEFLDLAESEGLEHPMYLLAIRLQFAFAARMSEIVNLEWDWIDFEDRRVVWPDSKTGGMSKPLSDEAYDLLENAPRFSRSRYVVPGIANASKPMTKTSYWSAWKRILEASGIGHVGTHGIRHRAATDIANSGIPLKVGMTLTAHKTVEMFMRYVHVEDDQVRAAAEIVSNRRNKIIGSRSRATSPTTNRALDQLAAGGAVPMPVRARVKTQMRRAANDR